jgi:N-acylneuraminate cytidylyltransferase
LGLWSIILPLNVGLIPARSGSKRVPDKNKRLLRGIPLVAYSIKSAIESKLFSEVIVSTDDPEIAKISEKFGASVPCLRPIEIAADTSPDIDWINFAIEHQITTPLTEVEFMAILRPTSPLRSSETIKNAFSHLRENVWADSLRAMEVTNKHPGKMWIVKNSLEAVPYLKQLNDSIPTYNNPTQSLPKVWIQNASLEIFRLSSFYETRSQSGNRILSFEMPNWEGFDINSESDWLLIESILDQKLNNFEN